jgi:hypothetical protein
MILVFAVTRPLIRMLIWVGELVSLPLLSRDEPKSMIGFRLIVIASKMLPTDPAGVIPWNPKFLIPLKSDGVWNVPRMRAQYVGSTVIFTAEVFACCASATTVGGVDPSIHVFSTRITSSEFAAVSADFEDGESDGIPKRNEMVSTLLVNPQQPTYLCMWWNSKSNDSPPRIHIG